MCLCAQSLSHVWLFVTPWIVAHQPPLTNFSTEFPQQEYWSGLPFPSPGHLSHPGIEPMFPPWAGRFFTPELPGKPMIPITCYILSYPIQCIQISLLTDVGIFHFLFLSCTNPDSHVFIPKALSSLYSVELILLTLFWKLNTGVHRPPISPNISELYITLFAPWQLKWKLWYFSGRVGLLTWRCWVYESVLS